MRDPVSVFYDGEQVYLQDENGAAIEYDRFNIPYRCSTRDFLMQVAEQLDDLHRSF